MSGPAQVMLALLQYSESSGGISVDALLTIPPSRPSFHAANIQSGTVLNNSLANLGVNAASVWNNTLAGFNCTQTLDPVACLRAVPATALKEFATMDGVSVSVVSDNTTYTPGSADSSLFTLGQSNLTTFVSSTFGILPELARNVSQAYATGTPGTGTNDSTAIARIFTEVGFQCPTTSLSRQIQAQGQPAFRYIYNATVPNIFAVPGAGAFHSSELPIVFSTYNLSMASAQQYALGDSMRGAWARFAKNPKAGPGWGAVGSFNGTDLAMSGADGSSGFTVVSPEEVDERCELYNVLYSLLGMLS